MTLYRTTPRAVLVGLPGSGKSTVGRRLAKVLAVAFADSDELIETRAGRSVGEIFAADGEAEFRRLEEQVIASALREFDGVLALGGGALGSAATREAIAGSGVTVVHLRAATATLRARIGDGHTRPLLADDPDARLAELSRERGPLYAGAATLTVEVGALTPGQLAARIAARLHALQVRR